MNTILFITLLTHVITHSLIPVNILTVYIYIGCLMFSFISHFLIIVCQSVIQLLKVFVFSWVVIKSRSLNVPSYHSRLWLISKPHCRELYVMWILIKAIILNFGFYTSGNCVTLYHGSGNWKDADVPADMKRVKGWIHTKIFHIVSRVALWLSL